MTQQELNTIKQGDTEDKFDHRYPFQTKCGWPARLLGVMNRSAFPLVVAVFNPAFGAEQLHTYNFDGMQPSTFISACVGPEQDELGVSKGSLSLVNIPPFTNIEGDEPLIPYLKATDFVHAVAVEDLEPMDLERSANPFHYDYMSMGSDLVRGWVIMHEGFDSKEDPQPLHSVTLINGRSGQRIQISLSTKKEQP